MPTATPKKRNRRPLVIAAVAVAAMAAGASGYFLTHRETPLHRAAITCNAGELSDGDHTLFLNMAGKAYGSGTLSQANVVCVLNDLAVPTYVTAAMGQTNALNGRQSIAWGDYEASWTYSPDAGLDVVLHLK
jgi:hypothetical protein